MSTASPLPWEHENVEVREDRSAYEVITDATGARLFDTLNSDAAVIHCGDDGPPAWWDEQGRVNAELACRAVNAHAALVAVCETVARTVAEAVELITAFGATPSDRILDLQVAAVNALRLAED